MREPVSESVYRCVRTSGSTWVNKWVIKSTNESLREWVSQSVSQSLCLLVIESVNQLVKQTYIQWGTWSVIQSVSQWIRRWIATVATENICLNYCLLHFVKLPCFNIVTFCSDMICFQMLAVWKLLKHNTVFMFCTSLVEASGNLVTVLSIC